MPSYSETRGTVNLAKAPHRKRNPVTGEQQLDGDALAQTLQHELGHIEGLPHGGSGVMRAGNHPTRRGEPQRPAELGSDGDTWVEASKSAILQVPPRPVPPPQPAPVDPQVLDALELSHGPNVYAQQGDRFRYELYFGVDPLADESYFQFGLYLAEEPELVSAPEIWEFLYEPFEETTDFLINGAPAVDGVGGWLTFFARDQVSLLSPGEVMSFSFVSLLPPAEIGLGEYYGVGHAGDAVFLLAAIPAPTTLALALPWLVTVVLLASGSGGAGRLVGLSPRRAALRPPARTAAATACR